MECCSYLTRDEPNMKLSWVDRRVCSTRRITFHYANAGTTYGQSEAPRKTAQIFPGLSHPMGFPRKTNSAKNNSVRTPWAVAAQVLAHWRQTFHLTSGFMTLLLLHRRDVLPLMDMFGITGDC